MSNRLKITIAVLAIPVLWVGWWLGSPLILDKEVDEAFPLSAAAEIPVEMTQEEVEEEMEEAANEPAAVVDEEMPEEETPTGPVAVVSGSVEGADEFHQASGTATIYRLEDGSHVLRLEDFEVTNGPDLHVLLVPNADPGDRDDLTGYVDLGELKGNVGNQNYEIPADVDVSEFGSVVIYCVPFHVLFGGASLAGV